MRIVINELKDRLAAKITRLAQAVSFGCLCRYRLRGQFGDIDPGIRRLFGSSRAEGRGHLLVSLIRYRGSVGRAGSGAKP
jgi:hypothetical protein